MTYKYESQGEVWLVVPQADATKATSGRPSAIENYEQGQRLWQEARFAVLVDTPLSKTEELPTNHCVVEVPKAPSPADLRGEIFHGKKIDIHLDRDIADYIHRHRLFVPGTPGRDAFFKIDRPELFIVHDERNPRAVEIAQSYQRYQSSTPNLILV
ncbi:MAG: hypothetical protein ACKOAH_29350, partial [Pirellula sp.]